MDVENTWFIILDDEQVGPMSLEDLFGLFMKGVANEESFIWRPDYSDWKPAREVAELHALLVNLDPKPTAKELVPPTPPPSPTSAIVTPTVSNPNEDAPVSQSQLNSQLEVKAQQSESETPSLPEQSSLNNQTEVGSSIKTLFFEVCTLGLIIGIGVVLLLVIYPSLHKRNMPLSDLIEKDTIEKVEVKKSIPVIDNAAILRLDCEREFETYSKCMQEAMAARGCYAKTINDPRWGVQNCSYVIVASLDDCSHLMKGMDYCEQYLD